MKLCLSVYYGDREIGEEQTMMIRTATENDLPDLLAIYNYEILNGTATFDLQTKTLDERREWFFAHNVGNHPLLTAVLDGHAAGYASLSPYREKEAYAATVELSVYVDPKYRRRGVARCLMTEILAWARECPDIHTVVSVITGENDASIRLHQEFGFTDCGTLREVGEKFGRRLDIVNLQLMV